jgi:hypothetical protein
MDGAQRILSTLELKMLYQHFWSNCLQSTQTVVLSHPLCKGRTMDGAQRILSTLELKML